MLASRGKPPWLRILPPAPAFAETKSIVRKNGLVTVCQEAQCPNMAECWSGGTATFMVLGDTCTRGCRFCAVKSARTGQPPDRTEPERLAQAVAEMKLDYAVITSVDRDDLPDQGAGHFAACIRAIKGRNPAVMVEVLIPDFRGSKELVGRIVDARPDVIAHNIETVRRLQGSVRDRRAGYEQSLSVLRAAKAMNPGIFTKSSLMLGLGEKEEEVVETMQDLRAAGVDIITLGQYLRPSSWHLEVAEYVHPDKFAWYNEQARKMGFLYCASGPFVRSSYRAGELFLKALLQKSGSPTAPPEPASHGQGD